jgi:hypothetical protein
MRIYGGSPISPTPIDQAIQAILNPINPQSSIRSIRNPQSSIRNPQSPIRNPQSDQSAIHNLIIDISGVPA